MTTKQAIEPRGYSDEVLERQRCRDGDRKFKLAMLQARRWKRERFPLGVITRPGTECPRYTPARGLPVIRAQSPGALCADMAGSNRAVTDSF